MNESITDRLKRLQDERDAMMKEREDVQTELGEIGERLKVLRAGQKKRQRALDDEQKRQIDRADKADKVEKSDKSDPSDRSHKTEKP